MKAKAAFLLLFDIVSTTFITEKDIVGKKVSKLRSIAELKRFTVLVWKEKNNHSVFDRTQFSGVVFVVFIYLYCRTTSLQFVLLCFPLPKALPATTRIKRETKTTYIGPVLVKAFPVDWSLERDGNSRSISRIPNILFKAKILKKTYIL